MIVESWTITILLIAVAFIYIRAKKRRYALGILSMTLVPLFHIFGAGLSILAGRFFHFPTASVRTAIDIFALIIACILMALLSGHIQSRKARTGFVSVCGAFMLILSSILILNI